MNREESWTVITGQRLSLADLLEDLSTAEWESPSLCAGWRIRDVAAHVAMAPQVPGIWSMVADGVRARGSFHRLNHDVAVRHATTGPSALVASCVSTRIAAAPFVTSYRNICSTSCPGQDIAIPRAAAAICPGRRRPAPPSRTGLAVWAALACAGYD